MNRRFVVQEHTVAAGDVHFDLMIEDDAGETLVTFQLEAAPSAAASGQRSFDHRLRYLEYEGPISGDRGQVRIWDRGEVADVAGTPRSELYRARFAGDRLRGIYALRAEGERVDLRPEDAA